MNTQATDSLLQPMLLSQHHRPPMFKTDTSADVSKLAQMRQADRMRGRAMQAALGALLDRVEGARAALPHLSALETALGRRGSGAVEEVPAHWLPRIIKQLSSLPMGDEEHQLQDLLSRLCRALARHQQRASTAAAGPTGPVPCLNNSHHSELADNLNDSLVNSVDIEELGHSAFLEEFATIAAAAKLTGTPAATAPVDVANADPAANADPDADAADPATEPAEFSLQPR